MVKEVKSVKKIKEVKSIEEEIQELRDKRKERAKLLPIMHKQLGVPEFFDALRFDYSKFDEERVKVFKENNNKAKIIFALSIIKAKIAAKARAKVTCTLRPDRKKGKRILTPNTAILSHQYSWGSVGKEHELFARVKEMELTTERMINHYKKCTGMNEKKVREFLLPPEDVWLSAEEAKSLKLCDKIEDIQ